MNPLVSGRQPVLGVGLSKTGTSSLAAALRILGYRVRHYDRDFMDAFSRQRAGRQAFEWPAEIDAFTDLPTALFYREFAATVPQLRFVLTVRQEDDWWRSMKAHAERYPLECRDDDPVRWDVRHMAYGFAAPHETFYRKRYREHRAAVERSVPRSQLLVMDITAGEGWPRLCEFLHVPEPDQPFPCLNKADSNELWFD